MDLDIILPARSLLPGLTQSLCPILTTTGALGAIAGSRIDSTAGRGQTLRGRGPRAWIGIWLLLLPRHTLSAG